MATTENGQTPPFTCASTTTTPPNTGHHSSSRVDSDPALIFAFIKSDKNLKPTAAQNNTNLRRFTCLWPFIRKTTAAKNVWIPVFPLTLNTYDGETVIKCCNGGENNFLANVIFSAAAVHIRKRLVFFYLFGLEEAIDGYLVNCCRNWADWDLPA